MESIGTLTGGIAHDFNNLLTVINGYSELASNIVTGDEKIDKYFKAIFKAGEKASNLVAQLLAFTRQQPIEIKVLDLNTIISDLNNMISRLIGSDIYIDTVLDPGLPLVQADPGQIEQILINLVVNARDAINENELKTSDRRININTKLVYLDAPYIKIHSDLEEGAYVLFSVGDSGSGMTEEVMNRIFEPFFTTKAEGKGTGLGLATVYGIVKQNKGNIQVYSELGRGTIFKIYWPASKSSLNNEQLQKKTFESATNNEHILLVDDDDEVRALAGEMLANLNYTVTEAGNGVEALHLLQDSSCRPNLILTDLVMPEMDGMELVLKAKQLLPGIKILYASGFADDRFLNNDQDGIENCFIQKPYTLYSIATKIREVLDSGNS